MEQIQARLLIEMMGRPAEHLTTTLTALVDRMGTEKGVKITHRKLYEAAPIKESKDLFSSFVELEVTFDSLNVLLGIMFAYMPSNVEIMSPQKLSFSREDISALANNLVARLHGYDGAAKNLINQRDVAYNQLRLLLANHPELKDEIIKNQQQPRVTPSETPAPTEKKKDKKSKKKSKR
jgi:hypothetical protein